jgi:hypothetical protein
MPEAVPNPDNVKTEPLPEIVMIPIGDLYVPDWNPRKYIDEGEMQKLMAYRKNGGQVPPIWVWKGAAHATGSTSEPTQPNQGSQLGASTQGPQAIISGQRRWIADTRLGKTHIASIILDIPLEEAMILAYASNSDSKPHWLESVISIERLYKAQTKKSQDKLGARLGGVTGARINYALKVAKALNPASRALIVNSVNDLGPEKACSEVAVRALANILTPEEVEKALPVFLESQITESQAKSYAGHVKAGNPPETFGQTPPKTTPILETGVSVASPTTGDSPKTEGPSLTFLEVLQALVTLPILWLAWKVVVWFIHLL